MRHITGRLIVTAILAYIAVIGWAMYTARPQAPAHSPIPVQETR